LKKKGGEEKKEWNRGPHGDQKGKQGGGKKGKKGGTGALGGGIKEDAYLEGVGPFLISGKD